MDSILGLYHQAMNGFQLVTFIAMHVRRLENTGTIGNGEAIWHYLHIFYDTHTRNFLKESGLTSQIDFSSRLFVNDVANLNLSTSVDSCESPTRGFPMWKFALSFAPASYFGNLNLDNWPKHSIVLGGHKDSVGWYPRGWHPLASARFQYSILMRELLITNMQMHSKQRFIDLFPGSNLRVCFSMMSLVPFFH